MRIRVIDCGRVRHPEQAGWVAMPDGWGSRLGFRWVRLLARCFIFFGPSVWTHESVDTLNLRSVQPRAPECLARTRYADAAILSRTDGSGSVAKTEYTTPAITAPMMGATQNSYGCSGW